VRAPAGTEAAPPAAQTEPQRSYPEMLAAAEAHRRTTDDVLLRKMLHVREPMNPDLGSSPGLGPGAPRSRGL
jgi:hypothetical protein